MILKDLISFVKKQLDDHKALDVTELDVTSLTNSMDRLLICTGTSTRHVRSIAKKTIHAIKEAGVRPLGVEGELYGEWILVDLGDVVLHIMLKEQRDLYHLEKLWAVSERSKRNSKRGA